MTDLDSPFDPPPGWQRDHTDRYVASAGEDGHHWQGATTLLLTTRGRRSGMARRTPLIYREYDQTFLIVASKGGSDRHPSWYLNLRADPRVRLQVGSDRFDAVARTATVQEKEQLWPLVTEQWPAYDDYQAGTKRQIPLVILQPV